MAFGTIRIRKPKLLMLDRSNRLLLTVFIMIFVSNDTFMFGTNSVSIMLEIPRVLMGAYIIYEIMRLIAIRAEVHKIVLIGLVMATLMVVISLYHGDPTKLIIIKCLCIISAVLLTAHYRFEEYAEVFTRVMVFLGAMALILEFIVLVLPGLALALPRVINSANNSISTIGFAGVSTKAIGMSIVRNYGIFWEPGVFPIYLNLAIMFELFTKPKISLRNIVVLIASVIITYSTTGYIVSLWIVATYFLLESKKTLSKRRIAYIVFTFFALLVSLFVLDFTYISENVFGKVTDTESGTWIARFASIFVNIDIFLDHPFVGIGMNQMNFEMIRRSAMMFARSTEHNTNTLLYQFAAHGIFYAGIFAAGTVMFPRCVSKKKSVVVMLAVALVLMYVGENLRYSMLPFVLIFYGFNQRDYVSSQNRL